LLGNTTIDGRSIRAPLAVYRSRRQWYALQFVCTVATYFKSVTDFRFAVGEAIPRDLWHAHALNAVDQNE
jgi:hypothetical protein